MSVEPLHGFYWGLGPRFMTIICALRQNGETWIGADSRATGNSSLIYASSIKKWAATSDAAIGATGDAHLTQLLQQNRAKILKDALPELIADRLLAVIKENSYSNKPHDDGGALSWGNSGLIATHQGVYDMDSTFMVLKIDDGVLWARGSGRNFALGAGHAARGDNPRARIVKALEAACAFQGDCGGQLFIHRLGHDPIPI